MGYFNPKKSSEIKGFFQFSKLIFPFFKGTVSVISKDHSCKDGNARFTTVSFKVCLIKYELDINVYNFEN